LVGLVRFAKGDVHPKVEDECREGGLELILGDLDRVNVHGLVDDPLTAPRVEMDDAAGGTTGREQQQREYPNPPHRVPRR
jgi:hypothetical protein